MIELLNTDCLAYMASLPDNAFDLAIVDPPYGIGASEMQMGLGKKLWKRGKGWDDAVPDETYFTELFRVTRNQIIWGANHFVLPISRGWIFWDKDVQADLSFSSGELAWTSFDRVLKKANIDYSGFRGKEGDKIHPTQKPIALYRWLLHHYANPGDRILDTHLGSASSAIAAHQMGFDFVGTELDPDYYAASVKRYNNAILQTKLF